MALDRLAIDRAGKLAQSGQFSIGGNRGLNRAAAQVIIVGTVVDANRKSRAIQEALVIFLFPGADIEAWFDSQDQDAIYACNYSMFVQM